MTDYRKQLDEWKTLKELTRLRLRSEFTKANRPAGTANENNAFVLVVDEYTQPIISSVMGRYELVEIGCASVVRIDIPESRAPQAALDAIYLVAPTVENMNRICDDFRTLEQTFHKCFCPCPGQDVLVQVRAFMYNEVHIFVTGTLTKELLTILKDSEGLRGQIKTLKQLSINYSPVEENVFTLNMANDVQTLFNCASPEVQGKAPGMITDIAQRLVTLCVTLDEKPLIRYCAASPLCQKLAQEFHTQLQAFITQYGWDRDRNPNGFHPHRGWKAVELAGTVLIVDRVEDLITPLLHDFAYQCAVQDLLEIKQGREYSYANSKGKTVRRLLDNNDALFQQIKYMHLSEAVEVIVGKAKSMDTEKKSGTAGGQKGEESLDELANRLRSFADKSRAVAEVTDHTHMAQCLFAEIKAHGLKAAAMQEQIFATNLDQNGGEYSYHKCREEIRECLISKTLSAIDKARLLALFQVASKQADQRKYMRDLAKLAAFPVNSNLFKGLLNQHKLMEAKTPPISAIHVNGRVDSRRKKENQAIAKSTKHSMRYQPLVKSIVEQHINGTLDRDEFPYHGAPAMMDGFVDRENIYGPRVIVFVAGGATYSEMRVLNMILRQQVVAVEKALAKDAQFTNGADSVRSSKIEAIREVILGSTSIVNPQQYMAKLCTADRDEEVTGEMLFNVLEFESQSGGEAKDSE